MLGTGIFIGMLFALLLREALGVPSFLVYPTLAVLIIVSSLMGA